MNTNDKDKATATATATATDEVQSNALLKGAGIASIVLAVINPPIGLLSSIVTMIWAKKSGNQQSLQHGAWLYL